MDKYLNCEVLLTWRSRRSRRSCHQLIESVFVLFWWLLLLQAWVALSWPRTRGCAYVTGFPKMVEGVSRGGPIRAADGSDVAGLPDEIPIWQPGVPRWTNESAGLLWRHGVVRRESNMANGCPMMDQSERRVAVTSQRLGEIQNGWRALQWRGGHKCNVISPKTQAWWCLICNKFLGQITNCLFTEVAHRIHSLSSKILCTVSCNIVRCTHAYGK